MAAAGLGATLITGDPRWDGAASIVIGAILGFTAWVLAVESKQLLIGESADAIRLGEAHEGGSLGSQPGAMVDRGGDDRPLAAHRGPPAVLRVWAHRVLTDTGRVPPAPAGRAGRR